MRLIATAVFGAFVSLAASSFSVNATQATELRNDRLPSVESLQSRPQIYVDTKSLNVVIDRAAIAHLKSGQFVSIGIDGGRFAYVVDQLINDSDVLEISGHLHDNPGKTITLGLRPEGLSGLIKTNDRIYALGYANKVHYFGEAGTQWMAKELATEMAALQVMPTPLGGKPPVKGAEAVELNLALLATMKPGDATVMQLPGMGYTRIAFDEIRPGNGSATWVGHLKDFGDSFTAVLTYSPGGTEGTILTPAGEVNLTIGPDGQQYVFNPALLGLVNGMQAGGSCALLHDHSADSPVSVGNEGTLSATKATTAQAAAATGSTVDVLVYYTPGMVTAYGGVAGMTARVESLVALANQAYSAGKLGHQIRRVGLELLNISDTTANTALLDQMRTRTGPFVGLNAKRDQLGADIVTVLRPFYASAQGMNCGVAYVSGANGGDVKGYGDLALSVVSDGTDKAGTNYYCANTTYAHELGHNMGLMHDRATVAKQGGGSGAKPYAFGYVAPSAKWGTIMSYTSPYQIKFSNPLDSTCNGTEVCGTAQTSPSSADNVAALNFTMPLIAAFRASTQASNVFSVSGIVTVNKSPVAGASLAVSAVSGGAASNVTCSVSGTNGVYTCSAPRGYGFTLTPNYKMASGSAITWTPATKVLTALAANQIADFAGISADLKYTLSGNVKVNGVATSGVVMKVSGTDAAKVTCLATSSSGDYSCSAPPAASFTVTPSMTVPTGGSLTWAPASASVAKMAANSSAPFAGTLTLPKFTLSGVVKVNGTVTAGVAMKVSGTDAAKVSCQATSSTGAYTCSAPSGASFVVTPSMTVAAGSTLTWAPASTSVSKMAANSTVPFTGTLTLPKFTLSGVVTVNGVAKSGVAMKVTGTDAAKVSCQATSSTGAYSCSAPSGASFIVTPSMTVAAGSTLTWSPASVSVSKLAGNATIPFSGTLIGPKMTLTIVTTVNGVKTTGIPLRITVNGSVTQVSCAAATDTTVKCQIPSTYSITVTPVPTAAGMTFSPATLSLPSLPSAATMTFVGKK
jgi:hypothetical protein